MTTFSLPLGHIEALVGIFATFVAAILLFAGLYLRIYQRGKTGRHFQFASEIAEARLAELRAAAAARIDALRVQFSELHTAYLRLRYPDPSVVHRGEERLTIRTPRGRCVFEKGVATVFPNGEVEPPPLVLRSHGFLIDGTDLLLLGDYETLDEPVLLGKLEPMISRARQAMHDAEHRGATLETGDATIWGYWDFVYFSTVVQSTVGFGDILPKSTLVRLLVVAQLLLSCFLLVVLLNALLSGQPSPTGT